MVNIYVLSLEQDKYYVGRTTSSDTRIEQHRNNNGSYWTKLYKYVSTIIIYENCDIFDEDKYVIMYMDKYGIDNVRGGTFSSIYLSNTDYNFINKMIYGAYDKCFKCGGQHFCNDCYKKAKITNIDIISKKIINECVLISNLNIERFREILIKINPIIFNISQNTLLLLCKKYNAIENHIINYNMFCSMLCDKFKI